MLTNFIEKTLLKNRLGDAVHHLPVVSPDQAEGLTDRVYQQMIREFLAAPPIALHTAIPELFAAAWTIAREALIAPPGDRIEREIVAAGVSGSNACPYCVDVHGGMIHTSDKHDLAADILAGKTGGATPGETDRARELLAWAGSAYKGTNDQAGTITTARKRPDFTPAERASFTGTAISFHYVNRMVNIFLDESPVPMGSLMNGLGLRNGMGKLFANMFGKRIVNVRAKQGESAGLLPTLSESEIAQAPDWSRGDEHIASAFVRAPRIFQSLGEKHLDDRVLTFAREKIAAWQGESTGLGRGWVEEDIARFEEHLRPQARLVLLTAFASFQVDDGVIADFKRAHPEPETLLAAAAWSAFAAAMRIGEWI